MQPKLETIRLCDRIVDFRESGVDAYLILGDERALLVDALMNEVGLVDAIRQITSLPVDVLITHGHGDHAGAEVVNLRAAGFPVYMDLVDVDLLIGMFGRPESERELYTPVKNGDVFDLGGIALEVLSVPGHTPGCLVAYAREQKWLFTGDTVGSGIFWMQLAGCSPLFEYASNLEVLIAATGSGADVTIYPGHAEQMPWQLTGQYLLDVLHITRGIIAGQIVGEDIQIELGQMVINCKSAAYGAMSSYCYDPANV